MSCNACCFPAHEGTISCPTVSSTCSPDILEHEKLTYNDLNPEYNSWTCKQAFFAQVTYLPHFQGMQLVGISGEETVLCCAEASTRTGHAFGKSNTQGNATPGPNLGQSAWEGMHS